MKILKKTAITIAFPALMFLIMLLITYNNSKCFVNGNYIFLETDMLKQIMINGAKGVCIALAIWIQMKNGRFDFSGGASMILSAIIAGNLGKASGSILVALVTALIMGVIFCTITGIVYVYGRIPIMICTIGMTLLYESLTYIVYEGEGVSGFFSNAKLAILGRFPGVLIPTVMAITIYVLYTYFSSSGRKAKILANNQSAGVNIGIDEKKNVIVSFVFSGLLVGFAAIVYVSQNNITAQTGLATAGIMFSNIVPVFMGSFIGMASKDVIGIISATIGIEIMNYGLNCMNLGAGGWRNVIFGVFVFAFYTFMAQLPNITIFIEKLTRNRKKQRV